MAPRLLDPRASAPPGPPPDLRLLLIEDDVEAAEGARGALSQAGWSVELARDGESGLRLALAGGQDVILVDRMLPGMDGLEVVAALRRAELDTPILVLTALGSVGDRVEGLEAGADDYLVKPYSFAELTARAHALARRSARGRAERTRLTVGPLVLDRLNRTLEREGSAVELLPLEFRLLDMLMRHAGRVVTRAMLLEQVWGFRFDPRTNIGETHLSRLRRKLYVPGRPSLISTVRGAGYVLAAE